MNTIKFDIHTKIGDFKISSSSDFTEGINYIWGRSGNGKSTILNSLAGFIPIENGIIKLNDNILYSTNEKINLPPEKREISYIQQSEKLFENLTVLQNIEFGYKFLRNHEKKITPSECLNLFKLQELSTLYPNDLSGGQKQKVSLARAFARNGKILMLDEPINSLDLFARKEILSILEKSTIDLNLCILFVTHFLDDIFETSKNILLVDKGIANKKIPKENILSFWKNDDEVLNQIENKGKFDKKFFSSISVILSKEKFIDKNSGFYFTGNIINVFKSKKMSLLQVYSNKDYYISIDNNLLDSLNLSVNNEVNCFVYRNLIS
tara:strand:+ start:12392 stop:13357 length:966 start_codon:yes stop_codon:yes gene_type:complete